MEFLHWAFSELTSYDAASWMVFISITVAAAFFLRGPGILLGHFLIAGVVFNLDFQWLRDEMAKPGWAGTPDQDLGFLVAVGLRIVAINTALLPVALLIARLRSCPRRTSRIATAFRDA